jgi:hypothetical protein
VLTCRILLKVSRASNHGGIAQHWQRPGYEQAAAEPQFNTDGRVLEPIEKIKLRPAVRRIEQAITDLAEVKQQDPGAYQRLAAGLRSILED